MISTASEVTKPGSHSHHGFVPAAGLGILTPLYDGFVRLSIREREFRSRLIAQASIREGQTVLDIGCGTGTLAIMIKQAYPGVRVVGLDVDPRILSMAREKVHRAGVEIELIEAMAFDPPLAEQTVDRVVSTLMLHHLTNDEKLRTLRRARALLRSGGQLHVADFGKPHSLPMRILALPLNVLDGNERRAGNLAGILPELMSEAGFHRVSTRHEMSTIFGTLAFYEAHI